MKSEISLAVMLSLLSVWHASRLMRRPLARSKEDKLLYYRWVFWNGRVGATAQVNKLVFWLFGTVATVLSGFFALAFVVEPSWQFACFILGTLYLELVLLSVTLDPRELRISDTGIHWKSLYPLPRIHSIALHSGGRFVFVKEGDTDSQVVVELGTLSQHEQKAIEAAIQAVLKKRQRRQND